MNRRRLRRNVRELGLGQRFTVTELAAALARKRARVLRLRPEALPADGFSGGLLVTDSVDFVAYQRNTSRVHQDHIICHEFGHLIAGHRTTSVLGAEALRLLAPNIDPVVVRRMLGRTGYGADAEREAEYIAEMLMADHISEWAPRVEWVVPDSVRRLANTLS